MSVGDELHSDGPQLPGESPDFSEVEGDPKSPRSSAVLSFLSYLGQLGGHSGWGEGSGAVTPQMVSKMLSVQFRGVSINSIYQIFKGVYNPLL